MIEKSTTHQVLAYFFTHPTTPIHLRELARQMKLSLPTISGVIKKLEKEELISVKRGKPLTIIQSRNDDEKFIAMKRVHNFEQLYQSGIIEALRKTHPQAIICFGSYSRGEDTERSDIDLAVIGTTKNIVLEQYEKKLHRSISLHTVALEKLNKEFASSLYNGIVIDGAI